jgi:hypothetical protein
MAKTPESPSAKFIDVDQYPPLLDEAASAEFLIQLSLHDTSKRANGALETKRAQISLAVRGYIEELEKAFRAGDIKATIGQAHEIRGLAANAGLEAVGRIADGLYKYLDAASRLEAPIEAAVISLHINAIARASTTASEAKTYGERVATELSALVAHKLQQLTS